MAVTVSLQELIDSMEMQFDEYLVYVDPKTGEVEQVQYALLSDLEEGKIEGDPSDEDDDELKIAKRIVNGEKFIRIPSKDDIHDWNMMHEFALSVESGQLRAELLSALRGPHAFRHFKDTLHRRGIQKDWYAFREQAFRTIAIDWLKEHGLAWRDDMRSARG